MNRLYGSDLASKAIDEASAEFHATSEMIQYYFDVDSMLYFVAQDWWKPYNQGERAPANYYVTEETLPAAFGASLGWTMQIDGDNHRNVFLNSPWVKAVLPMRPGREKEALEFLERPEVAGIDGLDALYPFDAKIDKDHPTWRGMTIRQVLLEVADTIAVDYEDRQKPTVTGVNGKLALPEEMVFETGFNPVEGGIDYNAAIGKCFAEWMEILPTDQIVATEYNPI
jgi:hypothetical protein